MKFLTTVTALSALCISAHASASCTTQSKGLFFYDEYDSYRVVSQCKASAYTSNYECDQNVRCDGYQRNPYPSGQVSCFATSRGLSFSATSYDVGSAAQSAVTQCRSNPYTSISECDASLSCSDAGYGGGGSQSTSCSTYSRGLNFSQTGYDVNSTSQSVVNECKANPYTSNSECQANLACSGGGYNPYPPRPQPPRPDPYPRPQPPRPQPPRPTPPPALITCTVTTQRTTYSGRGSSEGQATAAARDACLRSETSFVCNAGSVVCRR